MPKPPPASCQFDRSSAEACRSRGNQARGTVIVRPSARSALRECSSMRTPTMLSPGLGFEVFMPASQECLPSGLYHAFDPCQLDRGEAQVCGQANRDQPEFRAAIVAVDMHVGRLVRLVTVEIEAVGAAAKPSTAESCSPSMRQKPSFAGSKGALTTRGASGLTRPPGSELPWPRRCESHDDHRSPAWPRRGPPSPRRGRRTLLLHRCHRTRDE